MPLAFDIVRGRPALMFLRQIGTSEQAPSTVTATVSAAGAAAGVNTIPVTALPGGIPKNTVLTFSRAAGNPSTMKVVVTVDEQTSDTSIAVEAFEGAQGDGIPYSLAQNDAATWDGLYTDIASNALDFAVNEQTTELTAVTHGSATGVRVAIPEVTSVSPTITRQGMFFDDGQLIEDLVKNAKTPNANWWGKYVVPDSGGNAKVTYAGLGRVFGVGHPTPADNLITLSYSFRFIRDAYTITVAS